MPQFDRPDNARLYAVLTHLRHISVHSVDQDAQRIARAMTGAGEEAMRRILAEGENRTYVRTPRRARTP